MAGTGGAAEEMRRGSWRALRPLGIVGLLAILLMIALIAAVVARLAGAWQDEPRVNVRDLGQVLRYGKLPQTFFFGGMVWQAVEPRRIGPRLSLDRVGTAIGGIPVYHERGKPTNPFRSLYVPAAQSGPYADLYVRCNPGG